MANCRSTKVLSLLKDTSLVTPCRLLTQTISTLLPIEIQVTIACFQPNGAVLPNGISTSCHFQQKPSDQLSQKALLRPPMANRPQNVQLGGVSSSPRKSRPGTPHEHHVSAAETLSEFSYGSGSKCSGSSGESTGTGKNKVLPKEVRIPPTRHFRFSDIIVTTWPSCSNCTVAELFPETFETVLVGIGLTEVWTALKIGTTLYNDKSTTYF